MTNKKNSKASNRENKKNDLYRPQEGKSNDHLPPKYESMDGKPLK